MEWRDVGEKVVEIGFRVPFLVLHFLQVLFVHRPFVQRRTVPVDHRVVDVDWDESFVDMIIDRKVQLLGELFPSGGGQF